jgi:hypothetical protein
MSKRSRYEFKEPSVEDFSFCIALFAGLSVTLAQAEPAADVVTITSNLENDAVKADLADKPDFYQKVLSEDWTRGDSDGTYFTNAVLLNLMADTLRQAANRSLSSRCACTVTPP